MYFDYFVKTRQTYPPEKNIYRCLAVISYNMCGHALLSQKKNVEKLKICG